MSDPGFDHDRLDAYRLGREAVRGVRLVLQRVPRGHGELVDQLKRASPTCLNIAEGAGAWLPKEKARFYRIARASATECVAVLDHLVDMHILKDGDIKACRSLYGRVVATLIRLAIAVETTRTEAPAPARDRAPARTRASRT